MNGLIRIGRVLAWAATRIATTPGVLTNNTFFLQSVFNGTKERANKRKNRDWSSPEHAVAF